MSVNIKKIDEGRYALDIRGFVCPYPQVLTMRAIEKLKPNEIIEVILDNPPSAETIPGAIEKQGYKVLEVSKMDKVLWKIVIKK